VPIDASILVVDTPSAVTVNANDAVPREALLREIRRRLIAPAKRVVVLKSHSPASVGVAVYRDGVRTPMKSKEDYAQAAQRVARALGVTHFVPFASNAFFCRRDSMWANDFKVVFEDLKRSWVSPEIAPCMPFVTMDLTTGDYRSDYDRVVRHLRVADEQKVEQREDQEREFRLPDDFDARLTAYLREIVLLRLLYPRGIGWRLTDSGGERFYRTLTGTLESAVPASADMVIRLPDKVLYEGLCNGILTDLGITVFIRVDTRIDLRRTYLLFLLMGLHDYRYFKSLRSSTDFARFYLPYFVPALFGRKLLAEPASATSPLLAGLSNETLARPSTTAA
jgi:hypothetical protein